MTRSLTAALTILASIMLPASLHAAEPVLLHAAGSLRESMTAVVKAFEARDRLRVEPKFGASGLLREAIAGGETAEVFASANMQHPLELSAQGKSGPVVLFARNRLCALARPGLDASTATVIDRMLDPGVKLGTSTPKADPAGDYAWEVFRRVEALRPGSFATLDAKALRLTGGPASAPPPAGRSVYSDLIQRGEADLFLTYCTNARTVVSEVAGAQVVELPEPVAVGADYGLTVVEGASPAAYRLALFILSPDGQAILARSGFAAPTLPGGQPSP